MSRRERRSILASAAFIGAACLFAPPVALAHFILMTPDSWMSQDALGGPQKLGPCGNEGGGTPTGTVTAFQPGETIAVTIDEVIMHPGHYRVVLAVNDRSELPEDPTVKAKGNDPCGSTEIQDPPVFPVLADNLLPHTRKFTEPQTFTVRLPTDVTCTKCTLQVVEFMSNHPKPCFYHHCADISIQGEVIYTTTTTTTLPALPSGGTTTTTTSPCRTARCALESVRQGPACGSDAIPVGIRRKLDRAPELLEQGETSAAAKARTLRKKAKRLLKQAGGAAMRASRGKRAKLSADCARSIKTTTDELLRGL